MALRYGNNYRIGIQLDSAIFNVAPSALTTGWTYFADKFEIGNEAPEQIDLKSKDNYIVKKDSGIIAGLKKPTITISGNLTYEHSILFLAMGLTLSGSNYTIADSNAVTSYTLIQQFATAEVNVATGCVLEKLSISGDSGGAIQYVATFRAGTIDRENTTTYQAFTTSPENVPFLFQEIGTPDLIDSSIKNMHSFSLELNRIFIDDKFLFQQSTVWTQALQCEIEGTFSANYIYDSVNDAKVFDSLIGTAIVKDIIKLQHTGDTYTYEITTQGKLTEYSLPDPERCIFEGGFTKKIMYDGTNAPLTITKTEPESS